MIKSTDVIPVWVGEEEYELDLGELLVSDDISKEFKEQASRYAWVAMLAARSEAVWLDTKDAVSQVYAEVDKDVRYNMEMTNTKMTEARVSQAVELDQAYRDAKLAQIDAREQFLILQAIEKAMSMRADMLISLGAQLRAEAQQIDMNIKEVKDEIDKVKKESRAKKVAEKAKKPPF